jgi:hypothetical protein
MMAHPNPFDETLHTWPAEEPNHRWAYGVKEGNFLLVLQFPDHRTGEWISCSPLHYEFVPAEQARQMALVTLERLQGGETDGK